MKYYVSVTGLKVKSLWYFPMFLKHAIPSFQQAQRAAGNVFAETKAKNGIQHTLTVWEDKKSMMLFLRSGAHAQAMKVTQQISDMSETKVYGYESDILPTWEEALKQWEEHGSYHGKKPDPIKPKTGSDGWSYKSALSLTIVTVAAVSSIKALLI